MIDDFFDGHTEEVVRRHLALGRITGEQAVRANRWLANRADQAAAAAAGREKDLREREVAAAESSADAAKRSAQSAMWAWIVSAISALIAFSALVVSLVKP